MVQWMRPPGARSTFQMGTSYSLAAPRQVRLLASAPGKTCKMAHLHELNASEGSLWPFGK